MKSFQSFVEQKLGKFPHFVIYAVLEWIMIILLFLDGFLAIFSTEFAKLFELKVPCLLCTRIEHALFQETEDFYYNNSICEVHKRDISSLAYCNVHKKLSDIRGMCKGCLLSFATEKESEFDKYKSVVGVLHKDIDHFVEEERKLLLKPLKNDEMELCDDHKGDTSKCSCCGELLNLKSSVKYRRSSSISNLSVPSPRAPLLAGRNEEGRTIEPSHIRYTEIKSTSDTESEVPEDDASNVDNQGREEIKAIISSSLPDPPADANGDTNRTPIAIKGNRFFAIPTDSPQMSPRWFNRSIKKLDLVLDPNDAAAVENEIDGDVLNRLKKQVHLDHRSLLALYMELDEERSASAVAANNAMAMITRLQAEKAAVQMEALQYQRMMEEQAEYDEEAMQVMKDMLVKKDEDIRALELELEVYREKYGRIRNVSSDICEVDGDDYYQDMKSQTLSSISEKSDGGSSSEGDQNEHERPYERSMEYGGGNQDEFSLDFEGERSYLLRLLDDLEKKMTTPSYERSIHAVHPSTIEHQDEDRGNGNKDILIITNEEVSLIRERLRAIEAESGFLKHAVMTLQRGGEGTKLLNEIAQHLRKIRRSIKSPSEDITNA